MKNIEIRAALSLEISFLRERCSRPIMFATNTVMIRLKDDSLPTSFLPYPGSHHVLSHLPLVGHFKNVSSLLF